MEEQLVSSETAILAKEKGFYIKGVVQCIYTSENEDLPELNNIQLVYDEDGYEYNNEEIYFSHNKVRSFNGYYQHPRWFAPTQALLAKWLREVHNIDVIVIPEFLLNIKFYSYAIYKDGVEINSRSLRFDEILNKSYQNIEEHINDEMFIKNIFNMKYGFNKYEAAFEKGLKESLTLIK